MNFMQSIQQGSRQVLRVLVTAGLLGGMLPHAQAVVAPEDYPLATSRSDSVKTNIMVLMDTSTSMGFTHMPDEVEGDYNNPRVGYFSFQCNALYFNPAGGEYYKLPKASNGIELPDPNFVAAPHNAYIDFPTADLYNQGVASADVRLRNLDNNFQAYEISTRRNVSGGSDTPQRAYYWEYTAANGSKPRLAYNSPQCLDAVSGTTFAATGGGTWRKYTISTGTTLASQFARWYTYYRTRINMMKSALSLAFNATDPVIGPAYRVGLLSMNPYNTDPVTGLVTDSSAVSDSKYQALKTFDNTARVDWFSKLFSQTPGGYSPAREGLARVGRHYANKTDSINAGMNYATGENPFQYSCQRNYTIMTTDGYWNTQNETRGPVGIDGATLIGQEDGSLTSSAGNTPYGVYDGSTTGTRYRTNQANQYRIEVCSTGQFILTTTTRTASVVQLRETIDQTMQHKDKWEKITTQFFRTTEQYKLATHNWFVTQKQRLRERWTTSASTLQYEQRRYQERGGGYDQLQRQEKWDRRTTTRYGYRDEAFKYRNYQYLASTSQKSQERYRFTYNTEQYRKTESYIQSRTTQYTTTKTANQASGFTRFATRSQQWGIAWRYEVYSNETWQPASSATCSAAGSGNCRVRNVLSDTVNYTNTIPTQTAPMDSCTRPEPAPSADNQWTTTSCEANVRWLDGNYNQVSSATPVAVSTSTCTNGQVSTVDKVKTSCADTSFTDIPVRLCSAGNYSNSTITSVSVVNSCGPITTQPTTAVASCTVGTTQAGASPFTITVCKNEGDPAASGRTDWVTKASCTAQSGTSSPFQKIECRTNYCAAADCSDTQTALATATPFGVNPSMAPGCTASTKANHTVACAWNNTSNVALQATSCSDIAAGSGNSWVKRTCNPRIQVDALDEVADCTAGTVQSSTSPFVITRCVNATTGPTAVQTIGECPTAEPTSPDYIRRTCETKITNDNTATAPCTSTTSNTSPYIHKECYSTVTTGYTAAACVASGPSGPGYVQRTCSAPFEETVGVAFGTCAAQAHAFNGTDTVTCNTINTGWQNASVCAAEGVDPPTAATNYRYVGCKYTPVAGNQQTCTAGGHCVVLINETYAPIQACAYPPGSANTTLLTGNVWYHRDAAGIDYYCRVNQTGPTVVQTCNNIAATSQNNWVRTTCTDSPTTNDYVDGSNNSVCTVGSTVGTAGATTTAASSPWTRTRCTDSYVVIRNAQNVDVPQNDVRAAACPGVGYNSTTQITTTCRETSTSATPVERCNVGVTPPGSGNNLTEQTCTRTESGTIPGPASCTVGSIEGNWVRTIACPTPVPSAPTYVSTCSGVAQTETAPDYIRTTCTQAAGFPTAEVAVQSGTCTAGFNSTTGEATVCRQAGYDWKFVGVCENGTGVVPASAGNLWRRTECAPSTSGNGSVNASTGITGSTWNGSSYEFRAVPGCTQQTGSEANGWATVTCRNTTDVADTPTANCTPQAPSAPNYIEKTCAPVNGQQLQYRGTTTRVAEVLSGSTASPTVVRSTTSTLIAQGNWTNIGSCGATANFPTTMTVPSPADVYQQVGSAAPELANCANWTGSSTSGNCQGESDGLGTSGSTGSLADVAQYYYVNDLKPMGTSTVGSLPNDETAGPLDDRVTHTHMTTFAVGMGVSGLVQYQDDYRVATTGDFAKIQQIQSGTLTYGGNNWPVWPDTAISSSTTQSYFDKPQSIDDFWHAAVNGRGRYLSAADADKVTAGLRGVLADISEGTGAGAATTSSTGTPTAGDNAVFSGSFSVASWSGNLTSASIDPLTGTFSSSGGWSAQTQLNLKIGAACDNRKIFYYKPSNTTNKLANFAWNTKACDSSMAPTGSAVSDLQSDSTLAAYFDTSESSQMVQFAQSSFGGTTQQRDLAVGANLVNFLRGQYGLEGFVGGDTSKLFRKRQEKNVNTPLGTIVGSRPTYVKAPDRAYSDNGYAAFKQDAVVSARPAMVYVGANDGMMHAFQASTGEELWAYVPTMVMPDLYKLANARYEHKFYVDGTVVSGDIVVDSTASTPVWKTIVVGGLNKGGRGFYALDVTNPTAAGVKALWEFKGSSNCYDAETAVGKSEDCGVGLSFGRPIITKLTTGQWVVLVTSGYDSEAYGGNGRGYLYVLNAYTGTIIHKIATSNAVGAGLREVETYVSNAGQNNMAERAYGGDLQGNIWRFDINGILAPTPAVPSQARFEATLVAKAADANGTAQPITTRPIVGEIRGRTMLIVGTGQLLSQNDLTIANPAPRQSVYAFLDTAIGASSDGLNGDVLYPNSTGTGSLRGTLKPLAFRVTQERTDTLPELRTIECDTTSAIYSEALCNSSMNWQVDLPAAGERVNLDMDVVGNTLSFISNVPSTADACSVGGYAYVNNVQVLTGLPVGGSGALASTELPMNALAVGSMLTTINPQNVGSCTPGVNGCNSSGSCVVGTPGCTVTNGGSCTEGQPNCLCQNGQCEICLNQRTDRGADGSVTTSCVPNTPPGSDGRRVSWRELIRE